MPRLIHVPVLHGSTEMGSEGSAYEAAFIACHGEEKWKARCSAYDSIWRAIAAGIDALALDPARVKLYQDSLPVCGREAELVHLLAQQGSHNHRLLETLMARGARLVGTESPNLLLEEIRLLKAESRDNDAANILLEHRDRFIAGQIDSTLGDDETGILFLGALHHVERHLPRRIAFDPLLIHDVTTADTEPNPAAAKPE